MTLKRSVGDVRRNGSRGVSLLKGPRQRPFYRDISGGYGTELILIFPPHGAVSPHGWTVKVMKDVLLRSDQWYAQAVNNRLGKAYMGQHSATKEAAARSLRKVLSNWKITL